MATTLSTQFSWNKDQFLHDIDSAYQGNYKNPHSPIYVKFLSWKVTHGTLEKIMKAIREHKITIFASQKYSKKVQDQMNSLLLERKEFKEDEVRKTWKSKVKFPGVLMVEKQQMKNTKFLTVILEKLFNCFDTLGGSSIFLRDIQPVYLSACGSLTFVSCC